MSTWRRRRPQLETVRAQLVDVGEARAQFEHAVGTIINQKLANFTIPPSPLEARAAADSARRALAARWSAGRTLPPPSAAPPPPTRRSASPISAFYPTITWAEQAALRAPTAAPGFRARARCGAWARRQRSCSSTPASATPSPTRRATTTRRRSANYKATVLPAFKRWRTSSQRSAHPRAGVGRRRRAVAAAQHSFDLSNQRYKGGVTSYLEVLTAEATLLHNQRTRPTSRPAVLQPACCSFAPSAAAGM